MGVQVSPGAPYIQAQKAIQTIEAKMKISDKLAKVDTSFSISRYDNGFLIEVSGRNKDEDYKTAKILVQTADELLELVREAVTMEIDE